MIAMMANYNPPLASRIMSNINLFSLLGFNPAHKFVQFNTKAIINIWTSIQRAPHTHITIPTILVTPPDTVLPSSQLPLFHHREAHNPDRLGLFWFPRRTIYSWQYTQAWSHFSELQKTGKYPLSGRHIPALEDGYYSPPVNPLTPMDFTLAMDWPLEWSVPADGGYFCGGNRYTMGGFFWGGPDWDKIDGVEYPNEENSDQDTGYESDVSAGVGVMVLARCGGWGEGNADGEFNRSDDRRHEAEMRTKWPKRREAHVEGIDVIVERILRFDEPAMDLLERLEILDEMCEMEEMFVVHEVNRWREEWADELEAITETMVMEKMAVGVPDREMDNEEPVLGHVEMAVDRLVAAETPAVGETTIPKKKLVFKNMTTVFKNLTDTEIGNNTVSKNNLQKNVPMIANSEKMSWAKVVASY